MQDLSASFSRITDWIAREDSDLGETLWILFILAVIVGVVCQAFAQVTRIVFDPSSRDYFELTTGATKKSWLAGILGGFLGAVGGAAYDIGGGQEAVSLGTPLLGSFAVAMIFMLLYRRTV